MRVNFRFLNNKNNYDFIVKCLNDENIKIINNIPAGAGKTKEFYNYFTIEIDGRKTNKFLNNLNKKTGFIIELINIYNVKKTYKEEKEKARQEAIDLQIELSDRCLSYGGLSIIYNFLQNIGRRYGLIKEFKENGLL